MRTGLSLALFLLAGPVLADEIRVESRVEAATVFPDGATVSRQAAFEVPEGRHTLLLSGLLGAGLDGNSLRASGEGDGAFTILAVELREPDPQALQERLRSDRQKWEDARERLEDQKRTAEDTKTAADRQLAFIDAAIRSASVGGEGEAAPTAQDWSALWRDSRAATQEALGMKQRADQLIRQLDRQLAALRPPVGNDGRDVAIAVEIEATQPVKGSLSVDYFIDDASWYPVYDARLITGDEPALTLARRAAISQRTAEDWRNVALTLSTARPSGRSEVRLPSSRWLRLVPEQPVALGGVASFGIAPPPPPPPPMGYAEPAPVYVEEAAEMRKATQAVAAIRQLGETVVFEIAARADIPGGGATRRVLIGEETPEVTLEVRATPAIEEAAYLYAAFTNDASLLLPGEASLSRDGLFIGRVGIDAIASGEEGAIPFGPLESVKVSHRVVEEKDGESFSRPEQTRRYRSEMTVENIGETPRTVRVYAALPQTGTDEIGVTPVVSPPVSEEDAEGKTGRLAWVFELAAGESETVSFGYDIAWPLGRQMLGG